MKMERDHSIEVFVNNIVKDLINNKDCSMVMMAETEKFKQQHPELHASPIEVIDGGEQGLWQAIDIYRYKNLIKEGILPMTLESTVKE
jgi:hypothetical protein